MSTIVSLLIFQQECLQLEVHPWSWHHVDIRDVGVVGLTAFLGEVPQQVLRVGIAGSPTHHFLVSFLQQIFHNLLWLLAVEFPNQLIKADVLKSGVVGWVGEVEGDLFLYCWVAGPQILDVLQSDAQLYVGDEDRDGHGAGPVGDQLRQLVQSVHAGLGAQADQARAGELGPLGACETEHVAPEQPGLVKHALAQIQAQLGTEAGGGRGWAGGHRG